MKINVDFINLPICFLHAFILFTCFMYTFLYILFFQVGKLVWVTIFLSNKQIAISKNYYLDFLDIIQCLVTNQNYIVCPLLGRVLEKSTFWGHIDMKELKPYIDYIRRPIDRHTEKKPIQFPITALCVQDPFDLSHNVTKAMNTNKVEKFCKACKYATRLLKKTLTGITSKTIERYSRNWHRKQNINSN